MYKIDELKNTVHCADCLSFMKSIPDGSIDAVICDPPYGTINCKWDNVIPFEPMWEQLKRITKKNGAIVLFGSQPFTSALVMSNPKMFKYEWMWDKGQGTGFLNAKKQPLRSCETISVFYDEQSTYNPQMRTGFKPYTCKQGETKTQNYGKQTGAVTVSDGSRFPLTRIEFTRDKEKGHPTQKPVALGRYLVRTYTNEGDIVLDFTAGAGSFGVAAILEKRHFIGIEKDEGYFKIMKERIEKAQEEVDSKLPL